MIECLEKNLLEFRALTWSAGVYSLLGTPPKGKEEAVKSSEAQRGSRPLVSERATALMDLRAGRAQCSTSCLPPAPGPPDGMLLLQISAQLISFTFCSCVTFSITSALTALVQTAGFLPTPNSLLWALDSPPWLYF